MILSALTTALPRLSDDELAEVEWVVNQLADATLDEDRELWSAELARICGGRNENLADVPTPEELDAEIAAAQERINTMRQPAPRRIVFKPDGP